MRELIKYLSINILWSASITKELKYQSIDSAFIEDINGSKYSAYNTCYKRRKGEASKGNNYDSPLLSNAINKCAIKCDTKKYQNNNRYKQYLLADSGYDSKESYPL